MDYPGVTKVLVLSLASGRREHGRLRHGARQEEE